MVGPVVKAPMKWIEMEELRFSWSCSRASQAKLAAEAAVGAEMLLIRLSQCFTLV